MIYITNFISTWLHNSGTSVVAAGTWVITAATCVITGGYSLITDFTQINIVVTWVITVFFQ